RDPAKIAVECDGEQTSYAELDQQANRLARLLQALGIGPEDRVGICMDRSAQVVVAMLAVLKAGAAYVSLDPDYPPDRLQFMLHDAGARLVCTQSSLAEKCRGVDWTQVIMERECIVIGAHDRSPLPAGITPTRLAYLIYTSGSTGQPKGV